MEAREVGNTVDGKAIIVKVEGISQEFGYRPFMADGKPNMHTPESFANVVAHMASKAISKILAASDKRDRKAAKRLGEAMLQGNAAIKAVRFDENPSPCRVKDE